MIDEQTLARAVELANADGELAECLFDWSGSVRLVVDDASWTIGVDQGAFSLVTGADTPAGTEFVVSGARDAWIRLLQPTPPPAFTDFVSRTGSGFTLSPKPSTAEEHQALRRLAELFRHVENGTDPTPVGLTRVGGALPRHAARIGRYLYLELDGVEQCIYYEEAGDGIPLLCQHTAGSDGRQWRHLLEDTRVTDRYRVIAYDLPLHGKSLPPAGVAWWAEEYLLTTEQAMAVPVGIADALGLDSPVFVGSSVGGMLALDLARYHPERFRAVISLEGGLAVPDHDEPVERLRSGRYLDSAFYAAEMFGVMGAPAPEAGKHETMLHYAEGAPGVFWGDSYYYLADHDLSGEAHLIDTEICPVYLLTGEYDHFTVPMTEEAHKAIAGSTMTIMPGLGHFPMSEDYDQLARFLGPVLDEIADRG